MLIACPSLHRSKRGRAPRGPEAAEGNAEQGSEDLTQEPQNQHSNLLQRGRLLHPSCRPRVKDRALVRKPVRDTKLRKPVACRRLSRPQSFVPRTVSF